eukprot:CAMPEP_0173173462 /NCGR_PEP_ID=MMETSP1141-20130122/2843_1 /TAXON_ID=483371 /ORGANISM="non described non described, Strain CCMP2298" /LENGTH=107 /DNA_ID=CAMNT_0014095543 /DNA_START=155 /DNA_END=478 /DNA_ORIENTATION=-
MASDSSNCNSSPAAIRQLEETLSSFTLNLAHSIVRSQGDCIPESMVARVGVWVPVVCDGFVRFVDIQPLCVQLGVCGDTVCQAKHLCIVAVQEAQQHQIQGRIQALR